MILLCDLNSNIFEPQLLEILKKNHSDDNSNGSIQRNSAGNESFRLEKIIVPDTIDYCFDVDRN